MKEVFVVDKIITTESSKGPGLKVELIPAKDVYSKNVKLVFSGDNTETVISLEMKPKQTQTKLGKK